MGVSGKRASVARHWRTSATPGSGESCMEPLFRIPC